MKIESPPQATSLVTLQTVLERVRAHKRLSPTRKRDLCSAVTSVAKLIGKPPAAIPLDLEVIRQALDSIRPARARISAKRWANLRSDLVAAIAASGLRPMLRTAGLELDDEWSRLLATTEPRIRHGLSRLARWASQRHISPKVIDDAVMARFITELQSATLVRNLPYQPRHLARMWNALARLPHARGLRPVSVPPSMCEPVRIPWHRLPKPFQEDVEGYLNWLSVPDPLAEGARTRRLAPQTIALQRNHLQSAVTAAVAAGIPLGELTSLLALVAPDSVRALLRHRWKEDGNRFSSFTHAIAVTLVAVASQWVKAPVDQVAALKALRAKLGVPPSGLTEKNKAMLRGFADPCLVDDLIELPERLWHAARRTVATRHWSFLDLQTALAIDILIHVPLRMQNLISLKFGEHLHFPQGRRKPALLTFKGDETKNDVPLEFELPTAVAERLWIYRNEIAPSVVGHHPDTLFVSRESTPRTYAAIKYGIERAVLRHLGVKITPHQFRHLAAKIYLDGHPGAYELVRQLLGHKNLQTTTKFYAGIDTRRAGRAHADLIARIRDSKPGPKPPRR
jgi:integrase